MKLNGLTVDPVTGKVSGVRLTKRRGRKRRRITVAMELKRAWQTALRELNDATANQARGGSECGSSTNFLKGENEE